MVTKLERIKSQLNAAKEAYKLESEERRRLDDDLENQREGYEESIACLQNERDDLKRQNDDLAISVQHYGTQMKQWSERYNDAHEEAVQTLRQLHEAKQKVESFRGVIDRQDRDIAKAIAAINQFIIVECGRDERPASVREMSIQERFVYHLLDVLNGK